MIILKIHISLCRSYSKNCFNRSIESSLKMYRLHENFEDNVQLAVKHVQLGNVIAIPTDTIYGLASNAQDKEAIQKLYKIKGREFIKPLSICVSSIARLKLYAQVDHLPFDILNELLPGPVTIILNRTEKLNPQLNPTTQKVGIRIPKHAFVQQLTARLDAPIALTSANKSNCASSVRVDEFSLLWNQVDAVFDGGILGTEKSGSTIIDLSERGKYTIVREGCYFAKCLKILKTFY